MIFADSTDRQSPYYIGERREWREERALNVLLPPARLQPPRMTEDNDDVASETEFGFAGPVPQTSSSSGSEQQTDHVTGKGDPMERFYGMENGE